MIIWCWVMAELTLPLRTFLGFPPLLFPSVTARRAPKRRSVTKICWKKDKGGFLRRLSKEEKIERFTLRSQFERLSPWTRLRGRRIMRKRWWNNCLHLHLSCLDGNKIDRKMDLMRKRWWNNCLHLLETFEIVSNLRFHGTETQLKIQLVSYSWEEV